MYAAQAKVGKVDGFAMPAVTRPRPALIAVDAAHGFAYPAIEAAEAAAARRRRARRASPRRRSAARTIAAPPAIRSSGWPRPGLVALMFVNTPSAIAPWGGSKAVFGTNPIAFACPLPGRAPLVIDLSLSKVARGNIMTAKQRGEKIPEGWALDDARQPTTDPDAALRGTMVPMGDAKGTALALMVELLAAGLTGANFAAEASSYPRRRGPAARHRAVAHRVRSGGVRRRRGGALRRAGAVDREPARRAAAGRAAARGARRRRRRKG